MDAPRRPSLLLSAVAAAAFWLLADAPLRLYRLRRDVSFHLYDEGLSVLPSWKVLLLVAITTAVFALTARIVYALGATPRQRRWLWPLALAVLYGLAAAGWDATERRIGEDWRRDHHLPLRLERDGLAGTAWWDVTGGDCGYITLDVVVFESETRATRYRQGGYPDEPLFPILYLLGSWPTGHRTASGEILDGVVTWTEEDGYTSRERIRASRDRLYLDWVPEARVPETR